MNWGRIGTAGLFSITKKQIGVWFWKIPVRIRKIRVYVKIQGKSWKEGLGFFSETYETRRRLGILFLFFKEEQAEFDLFIVCF